MSEGVRLKRPQAVSLLVLTTHTSKQRNYSHPFGSFLELLCSGNSNEIEGKSNQLSPSFSEFWVADLLKLKPHDPSALQVDLSSRIPFVGDLSLD